MYVTNRCYTEIKKRNMKVYKRYALTDIKKKQVKIKCQIKIN